jgi:hypothetical protein
MKRLHLTLILILTLISNVASFANNKVSEKVNKNEDKIKFETGIEVIEKPKKVKLKITRAKGLEIYVSGEIHSSEILRIYEYNQQEDEKEIFQGQGVLKPKQQPLIVIDNKILVTFNTKDKTTRKGATVEIKELKAEKFLEYVRKDVSEIFHKLEQDEHIGKIDQTLKESNDILQKLQTKEIFHDNKQVSESLRILVEKYRSISSHKGAISKIHQALQNRSNYLKKQGAKWSKRLNEITQKKSEIEKELINQQSKRWLGGAKDFEDLSKEIGTYNEALNKLFKKSDENAQIFYETANNIDLNLNPLSETLRHLIDLKGDLHELNQHWQTIHKLKEQLKNSGFLLEISNQKNESDSSAEQNKLSH